jgi:hypothetical protein
MLPTASSSIGTPSPTTQKTPVNQRLRLCAARSIAFFLASSNLSDGNAPGVQVLFNRGVVQGVAQRLFSDESD